MSDAHADTLLRLTVQIVAAYVTNNIVAPETLPDQIRSVHVALVGSTPTSLETLKPTPAAAPRQSVFQDHIICLEDGKS